MFYTGGLVAGVNFTSGTKQDETIRYFPRQAFGDKNCYEVPVANGRYHIRMSLAYFNYDKKNRQPEFDVAVEGTIAFSFDSPWDASVDDEEHVDAYAFIKDGTATVCLYSERDVPLIATLEIIQVDFDSYASAETGTDVILITYDRVTCGMNQFGSGLTSDGTEGGRVWYPPLGEFDEAELLRTSNRIANCSIAPNYFPEMLYQNARVGKSADRMSYTRDVDPNFDYAIWLHFAEIAPNVGAGQRVFNVTVNGEVCFANLDIVLEAGGPFAALDKYVILKNLTTPFIAIEFISVTGMPTLICGLEIFAILQVQPTTDPIEGKCRRNWESHAFGCPW